MLGSTLPALLLVTLALLPLVKGAVIGVQWTLAGAKSSTAGTRL